MQTALYGKIKESRGEWLIGANTQNYLNFELQEHNTREDKGAYGAY